MREEASNAKAALASNSYPPQLHAQPLRAEQNALFVTRLWCWAFPEANISQSFGATARQVPVYNTEDGASRESCSTVLPLEPGFVFFESFHTFLLLAIIMGLRGLAFGANLLTVVSSLVASQDLPGSVAARSDTEPSHACGDLIRNAHASESPPLAFRREFL